MRARVMETACPLTARVTHLLQGATEVMSATWTRPKELMPRGCDWLMTVTLLLTTCPQFHRRRGNTPSSLVTAAVVRTAWAAEAIFWPWRDVMFVDAAPTGLSFMRKKVGVIGMIRPAMTEGLTGRVRAADPGPMPMANAMGPLLLPSVAAVRPRLMAPRVPPGTVVAMRMLLVVTPACLVAVATR